MKKINQITLLGYLTLLSVCALGLVYVFKMSNLEAGICLWLSGFVIFIPFFMSEPRPNKKTKNQIFLGISLLLLAFAAACLNLNYIFLVAVAVFAYFNSFRASMYAAAAIFVWLVLCNNVDAIHFSISYPLQIINAHLSSFVLNLFGQNVSADNAIMTFNGKQIAITAACSGVQQLEAMILFAAVIVAFKGISFLKKLAYFSLILPLIIFFNLVRLIITFIGSLFYPDFFLGNFAHATLGLLMVLGVALVFYSMGSLFELEGGKKI